MVYIIDKMIVDESHQIFNTGFIKVLDLSFPGTKIFYGDPNHIKYLEPNFLLTNNRIKFKKSKIVDTSKLKNPLLKVLGLIGKFIIDSSLFLFILLKCNARKDFIFVTHVHPVSLIFLKGLKFFFPSKKVILVLHGEVDSVFKTNIGRLNKITGKIYRWVLSMKQKRFYYITLSKHGKKKLNKSGLLEPSETLFIHHPYDYSNDTNQAFESDYGEGAVCIGHIGSLSIRKNGAAIIQIFENMVATGIQDAIKIEIIGATDVAMQQMLNKIIERTNLSSTFLTRSEYELRIQTIDYALFLFTNADYIVRVSGSLYDAIQFSKPIIALKCDYLQEVFDEAGDIGFLCDTIDELTYVLNNQLLNNDRERYQSQVKQIIVYKERMSLMNIANNLKDNLAKL